MLLILGSNHACTRERFYLLNLVDMWGLVGTCPRKILRFSPPQAEVEFEKKFSSIVHR